MTEKKAITLFIDKSNDKSQSCTNILEKFVLIFILRKRCLLKGLLMFMFSIRKGIKLNSVCLSILQLIFSLVRDHCEKSVARCRGMVFTRVVAWPDTACLQACP